MSGLVGNSGSVGEQGLLELTLAMQRSGTLVVRRGLGTRLFLLHEGSLKSTTTLGSPGEQDGSSVDFHFEPHGAGDLPQLTSSFPESVVGAFRAVPMLGPPQPLTPGTVDLRALVAKARNDGLSAALTVQSGEERGLALFHEGRIGAAFFERANHVWERSDALRAIYRHSLENGQPPLLLHRLESDLAGSLLGLALERRAGTGNPDSFTGVSASEGGYTFYSRGKPCLHVTARNSGAHGRFAPLQTVPDLALPDDPPGWEQRRFDLTLRGRDALNPMTELSMEFSHSYGNSGKQVLEAVRRGLSIEDAAARLELDLQGLKPWIERLEADGLIRVRR